MDRIIEYMLEEDGGFGDITSEAVVDEDKTFHSALYDSYVCWCAHLVLQSWD